MSHRCGSGCLRKQKRRAECETCNKYKESRRKTVPAPDAPGGRVTISVHWKRDKPHPEVSLKDVAYVLANWRIRGISYDSDGVPSFRHYAFVPDKDKVVRVALSADGTRMASAFIDSRATNHWKKANMAYFASRLENMEVRDAFGN